MDNQYIRGLRIQKKSVVKRLYAAVCLVLVAALLLSTASFAWLTLSLAPEVSDVTTTLGANGNLEIALATKDHLESLEANNMYDDDSNFEYATGDVVHDNVLWGNLIDLTAVDYGLHVLNMRPAVLNILDGCVADAPISVGKYGADGRLDTLNFSTENVDLDTIGFTSVYSTDKASYYAGNVAMSIDDLKSGNYDKETLVQSILDNRDYGVRIAGLLDYSATVDQNQNTANIDLLVDGYCFAIDLLFRTNAPMGNLMLQTMGTQRMESELEDEYVGAGSFIEMDNEILSAAMKVVFADTLTGEVYALAQADSEGRLWITARADENGNLIPTASDDAALIKPLTQNQVSAITAWVFVDGNQVDNSAASTKDATAMKLNLQFSTDTVLNPAYTDKNTNPDYPNRPEMPVNPDGTLSVGEKYVFGSYEQDNNLANGAEPIEWRCLAREGNKVLLISLHGLDAMAYNPSTDDVTWETSAVRSWLNSIFINNAFTATEQESILTTHLANDGESRHYGIPEGNSTNDKIFFLSESEALSYFANDEARLATATAYAIANGAIVEDINGVKNITCWWTRTPGAEANSVTLVCGDGAVSGGIYLRGANNESISVRPAMWITLDKNSDENPDTPVVPEIPKDEVYYLSDDGGNNFTVYTLANDGSRKYELHFAGAINESTNTVTLKQVSSYPVEGIIIPAQAIKAPSGTEYAVQVDPTTAPFADLGTTNAVVAFVIMNDAKVGIVSSDLRNLFDYNAGTGFVSIDLSGLDTSTATDMREMFQGCNRLTYLNLDGFDTSSAVEMSFMFDGCSSLTELDVSSFNTANVYAMSSMFAGCSRLSKLDVSGFNTENVTITASMFAGCSNLTELDVSGFNTAKVSHMGAMFYGCSGLSELDVSGFNTAKATNMSSLFYECSGLSELDVSGFNTAKVTDMSFMFYECSGLTELDIRNFNTSNVVDMGAMFYECSGLTELDVSNFNTAKVEDMNVMFWNCSGLTELNLNGFDTATVADMSWMFRGCTSLTELNLASFDTTSAVNISGMFYNCTALVRLDMSGWDISNAEKTAEFFTNCSSLKTITTPNITGNATINLPGTYLCGANGSTYTVLNKNVPTNTVLTKVSGVTADDGEVYYFTEGATSGSYIIYTLTADNQRNYQLPVTAKLSESNKTLTISSVNGYPTGGVVIPAIVTADDEAEYTVMLNTSNKPFYSLNSQNASIVFVAVNGQFVELYGTSTYNLFKTNSSTKLVSLDVSALDTSRVTSMNSTFKECDALVSLDISEWDTSKVTNMDYMFYDCASLNSLDVGNFDTSSVTSMKYMFSGAESLITLDVSEWDMSSVTTLDRMFYGCSALSELDVSNWDTSAVTNLDYTFCGCEGLSALDVSHWDTSSATSADRLFADCELITFLDVSNWDTGMIQNMNSMFSRCKKLKTLDVSNWNMASVKTMQYMFYYCNSVEELDVASWNTSNVTDMKYLFADCYKITSLDLSNWNTSKVENMSAMFLTSTPDNAGALTDLNISGIDTSSVVYMNSMFGNCKGLTELDLSHFDTSSVQTMYAMFAGCENLRVLNTSGWDTSAVTNMAQMFQSCDGFTSLDLSHFDTSSVTTMSSMFIYASNLQTVNLSSFDTTSVTDMRKMFYDCRSLKTVIVGDGWDTTNADTTDIYTGTLISD